MHQAISLVVSHLQQASQFYVQAFGFVEVSSEGIVLTGLSQEKHNRDHYCCLQSKSKQIFIL